MSKKRIGKITWILLSLIALGILGMSLRYYQKRVSVTRIGFINYSSFHLARIQQANPSKWISLVEIPEEKIASSLDRLDALFVFGRGLKLNEEQVETIRQAGSKGLPVFAELANPDQEVTNLEGKKLDEINAYLRNGGGKNYRNFLLYTRAVLNGKSWFAPTPAAPIFISRDVLFHLDDERTFESVAEYERYLKSLQIYQEEKPKIALLTSVPGPFNANRDHLDAIIEAFQNKGWNVYPIASTSKRLTFLQAIQPDVVVEMPHGRISAGDAPQVIKWLKDQEIPLLAPLSIFDTYEHWQADPQGMNGGLLTMSVVLPELDGGVAPYAWTAQFKDEHGYDIYRVIPGRLEKFCGLVEHWIDLKRKANKDKKIAIYYFKGPGMNSLTASNLEVVPSLYHTLQRLKQAGYRVDGLPASAKELEKLLQLNGAVLKPYAEGTLNRFFREGNPALVSADTLQAWMKQDLTSQMQEAVLEKYGKAPGTYMATQRHHEDYLGVARIQLGNVVLLPQPLPGIGDNTFELVHGAKVAPPYPYIAAYLWTRHAFQADALLHFGTHGSLEFTPGKQVALGDNDWSDALIGNVPHFYLYTMSNVGEAIIAKRRSYATILSHLTAPFMQSGTSRELGQLEADLHRWEELENPALKAEYGKSISTKAKQLGLYHDIGVKEERLLHADELKKLSDLVEEVDNEKVGQGLYTIGTPYNDQQLDETVLQMSVDPLAYGLAQMDIAKGLIKPDILENRYAFNKRYRNRALGYLKQRLISADTSLRGVLTSTDITRAQIWLKQQHTVNEEAMVQGFIAMDAASAKRPHRGKPDAKQKGHLQDMQQLQELVVKIKPFPDKVKFLNNLRSDKRFQDATALLDPKALERAKKIATAIPKMKAAITISEDPAVHQILKLIQQDPLRTHLFKLLEDPSLNQRVAAEKEKIRQRILAEAASPAKQQTLEWLRDRSVEGLNSDQLRQRLADLTFFETNRDLLHLAPPPAILQQAEEKTKNRLAFLDAQEESFARAFLAVRRGLTQIAHDRKALQRSTDLELEALLNAFQGGYTAPSAGGDPIASPTALPTGRNLYSIDAEKTPSQQGWTLGTQLAQKVIQEYLQQHEGKYPEKVALTLWAGDFIQTDGAMMAEAFYLLGVAPIWDALGKVADIRLIPAAQLKRPRIDVVIQTSGQFRDLAASRLPLLNKAVALAAQAHDGDGITNYVQEGASRTERILKEKGFSPKEAKEFATLRVFGGIDGQYGSGIMGMVEKGDAYSYSDEVATTYLHNMGAVYQDGQTWATYKEGLFETALQHTDVVLQPRQSNTWGPLSLDHVYEFAGGMNNAVRKVTGKEPDVLFSDFRNPFHARVQNMKEAIWVEARSTLLNPKYVQGMMAGGSSSAETFAETFRNTFGWSVMKSDAIDNALWHELQQVYVADKLALGTKDFFQQRNPFALEEMTGVLLEAHRKGFWKATDAELKATASLHVQLATEHGAGCSAFVCGNAQLREEVAKYLDATQQQSYDQALNQALKAGTDNQGQLMLRKEEQKTASTNSKTQAEKRPSTPWYYLLAGLSILGLLIALVRRRRKTQTK